MTFGIRLLSDQYIRMRIAVIGAPGYIQEAPVDVCEVDFNWARVLQDQIHLRRYHIRQCHHRCRQLVEFVHSHPVAKVVRSVN